MDKLRICTIFATLAVTLCAPKRQTCPSRCISCENGVVQCSGKRLITPPKDIPSDATTIVLEDNLLRVLGSRSFKKLEKVRLLFSFLYHY